MPVKPDMRRKANMETEKNKEPLFGDLTIAQVAAGALAAATSFALSHKIGVAGSMIGAVVGSVAARVAGQLYTSVISRSLEGIHSIDTHKDAEPNATRRHALGAAVAALLVGVIAVGVYASGVTAATDGQGIGTQATVIEYVTGAPAEQAETDDAATLEDGADTDAADAAPTEVDETSATDAEPTDTGQDPAQELPVDGEAPTASDEVADPTQPSTTEPAQAGEAPAQG